MPQLQLPLTYFENVADVVAAAAGSVARSLPDSATFMLVCVCVRVGRVVIEVVCADKDLSVSSKGPTPPNTDTCGPFRAP